MHLCMGSRARRPKIGLGFTTETTEGSISQFLQLFQRVKESLFTTEGMTEVRPKGGVHGLYLQAVPSFLHTRRYTVTFPLGCLIAAPVTVSATTGRPRSSQISPVWSYRLRRR
jgi:hypothetical protein